MIQANELRINNVFQAEDDFLNMTCFVRITEIYEKSVQWSSITECNKYFIQKDLLIDLEPIPLTPEILIACGFKMDNFSKKYKLNVDDDSREYFIVLEEDGFVLEHNAGSYCEGASLKLYHIKYLHQLQNAFYILTSKELNYKP